MGKFTIIKALKYVSIDNFYQKCKNPISWVKFFQNNNSYSISRFNLIVFFDPFPNFNNTYFFKDGYRLFVEYVELKENDIFSS